MLLTVSVTNTVSITNIMSVTNTMNVTKIKSVTNRRTVTNIMVVHTIVKHLRHSTATDPHSFQYTGHMRVTGCTAALEDPPLVRCYNSLATHKSI